MYLQPRSVLRFTGFSRRPHGSPLFLPFSTLIYVSKSLFLMTSCRWP